ncbi:MAG: acetyl-CoA carboxylase carboxyltransferase subunit beta [Thermoanaerobacteraceae bacterium]|uniref:acetyl-CoA carboxylase, carboxyltransferase subunit beta n=1 Tax=Thermanaeromonas sp. C210 TaxID=2731925 RepID=UPI00155BBE5B|nr:acetyl-CoA carboxylase, carboxyltransferase subunit beta [Thermanaeromonas sp. C210]MBE3580285.1 acetyl-CoA carboxylase carboxyltransferase subunit beta [Thermoanaerobacteraceae bacterium]GFN22883.1 acetyl-coenzyme A carboxylase carboxyl transferase subunit beta [Thermanaeromonas sp. C210]
MFPGLKRTRYIEVHASAYARENPLGKCPECREILIQKQLEDNLKVCPHCGYHFRLTAAERLQQTVDEGTFRELDAELTSRDPLSFPGYGEKLKEAREVTGLQEAVVTGYGEIEGEPCLLAVMDSHFMMGSMGLVVGEKIARAVEAALREGLPFVAFCASGGARMQEGTLSLLQMAKIAGLLQEFGRAGLLYISVLTDPTTGGVTASFASLGDIIIAEPRALICFTGPRVIEQTIGQKLPEGFQRAEFMLAKGFVDLIVPRKNMKATLARILRMHPRGDRNAAL